MDAPTLLIRPADEADLPAITAIYGHAVLHGASSYETVPPDAAEIGRRVAEVRGRGLPWLVAADDDGTVLGYAYASPFRTRPAYGWTVEDSVYVADGAQGRGVGRLLLDALIRRCTELGYRQMVAVIGDAANAGSVGLHARAGFTEVGRMSGMGFKHGRWLEWLMMRRPLGEGEETSPQER
ncbi:MAG TPA: GNAT family N-acetyltransferase [Azospirillaceae bacterium]|nr:GNAT family N-acetyltransferase [Azospirillaceae bacterium]